MRWISRGVVIGLGIAVLVQTAIVGTDYVRVWAARAWRNRNVDAMHRSATFLLGARASRYLDFLASSIPAEGSVVLPAGAGEFSEQSVLQFFLMPRTVPGCSCGGGQADPSSACSRCLLEPNRFVPAIGGFPPPGVLDGSKPFLPYPEDTGWFHGLWLGTPATPGSAQLGAADPRPTLLAAGIDLAIYVGLASLGGLLWAALAGPASGIRSSLLGLPLAGGLLTFTVFELARAGLKVTWGLYLLAWLALMLGAVVLRKRLRRDQGVDQGGRMADDAARGGNGWKSLSSIGWMGVCVLLGLAAVLSVARAYSIFDPIANWALKGYAIAHEGSILAGARWGGHGLAYPQNLHLLIALFRIVEGDVLPGSKLLDPVFALALGIGLYEFWRWCGVPRVAATLSVAVLFSTPIIYQHITYGYANFMFATYLLLGVTQFLWGVRAADGRRAILGGLLVGLAAWTRPEGGLLGLGLLLVLVAYSLGTRQRKAPLIAGVVPFVGIWATWLTFGGKHQAADEVGTILRKLLAVMPAEPPKWEILRAFLDYATSRLLNPSVWGLVFPVGALLLLAVLSVRSQARGSLHAGHDTATAVAAVATVAFCLGIVGLGFYYYESTTMLEVSFDRAFIPAAIACWTWAVAALGRIQPRASSARPAEVSQRAPAAPVGQADSMSFKGQPSGKVRA